MFNLQINNASLEDEAVYECQVGPNGTNKPIRASAKLNVLCKFIISYLHSQERNLFGRASSSSSNSPLQVSLCWTIFFIVALTFSVQVLISSVSVAVPPTGAELVGHTSGSQLMVKEEEEVELKCIIHNARPRPDIIWYLGDNEFVRGMSPQCQPNVSLAANHSFHPIIGCLQ